MRTAVIITGQARTFAHCWKTQREAVFRKLDDPHFFLSLAKPSDGATLVALEMLEHARPGKVFVEWVEQPAFPEELREQFERESYHAPYFRSVPVEAIWKQLWHLARGWDLYKANCDADGLPLIENFDRFVRIRPDLHFQSWTRPDDTLPKHLTGSRHVSIADCVFTPWWGSWGGAPDRFAYIVGHEAAAQYFNVFHRINELLAEGCAYHPETMLLRALERAGIRVSQTMDADFISIRTKEALAAGKQHDGPVYTNRDVLNYVNARLAEGGR